MKGIEPVMLAPCAACPFRKHGGVKLSRHRAEEIAHALIDQGRSFPCHETITYTEDTETGFECSPKTKHCFGAARMLLAMKQPNQLLQIAMRLGYFDPRQLKSKVRTARSLAEWLRFTQ